MEKKQNRAIVFGSKSVNATGLIRSLGMAGYSVTFVSTYSKIESKYVSEYLRLSEKDDGIDTLKNYIELLTEMPAIFTTDDHANELIDKNYLELSQIAYCPHANGELQKISDKCFMSELAVNAGLNVSNYKKVLLSTIEKCPIDMPVILKPYASYTGSKGDIRICRTEDEYEATLKEFKDKHYLEIMVQHLLDAENQYEIGLMGFSLPDGTVEIPCTIKKIRSWPIGRGSTSYAQIKNGLCGVDKEKLQNFVRATGYIGIFDIEMIVSDGAAYFIEINYRNGQYGYAPTVAGYNIPDNWFRGMRGEVLEKVGTVNEIFYMNERDDYLHVKHGNISRRQWMREFHEVSAYGVFCKGDQRPFVRQYVKIPDRICIKMKKIIKKLSDFFVREEWNIAIRAISDKRLYHDEGTAAPFYVIPNTFRYWCADPFIISVGETDYLFFEMFDRFRGRGVIGYRTIDENGKIGKMRQAYETDNHLSFPFVFEHGGDYYMMPESSYDKNLTLLKAKHFPDEWEVVKTWFSGDKVCDSVIFENKGKVYLLTQPIEYPYTHAKLNMYVLNDESWLAYDNNPIVNDSSCGRMAGAIIKDSGYLIRPGQDCKTYGDAINFSKIDEIGNGSYFEHNYMRVTSDKITLNNSSKVIRGIHTYNASKRYEVVDTKVENKVKLGYIFSLVKK